MREPIVTPFAAMIAFQTGIQAQTLSWVSGSASGLPANAVIGGQQGILTYAVCRATYTGGVHAGKVVDGKCNFTLGGAEGSASTFQVLTGAASLLS